MMAHVVAILLMILLLKKSYTGFVWSILHLDVQHHYKICNVCQTAGPKRLTYEPQTPFMPYGPFEKWEIDAIGLFPTSPIHKEYIVMGTDYMTRWDKGIATERIIAQVVAAFIFANICSRFGTPLEIISNRGPGFRANLVGELLGKLKIKSWHSSHY